MKHNSRGSGLRWGKATSSGRRWRGWMAMAGAVTGVLVLMVVFQGMAEPAEGGRTLQVGDAVELRRALWRAGAGDEVVLGDGVYPMELVPEASGDADRPLVIRAENSGRAVIDARGLGAALRHDGREHVRIEGLVFQNASNGTQAAQAMVRPGNHWTLRDCVIRGADGGGLGIERVRDVLIQDCIIEQNGQIGAAVSDSRRVELLRCVIRDNNPGVDRESQLIARGVDQRVEYRGRWHVDAAWEAGGIKVSSSDTVGLVDCRAYGNFGPALWADYANRNVVIYGNRVYENRNLSEGWEGVGILVEYHAEGPVLVQRNEVHDNEGPGILVAESRRVLVGRNVVIDDEIELRDMVRPEASLGEVQIVQNRLERATIQTSLGDWRADSGAAKQIEIYRNQWVDGPRFDWGGEVYTDLERIRGTLGFEPELPPIEEPRDAAGVGPD